MKDNVFWGILGGILVVWLVVFWLVGWGKKSAFDAENQKLEAKVKSMQRLAKSPVEEFPTEDLAELREKEYENRKADLDGAMEVIADRDRRFEKFFTSSSSPSVVQWQAKYADLLRDLKERYTEFAGLDEAPKFFEVDSPENQASLPDAQKQYNGFVAIVNAVMQHPGAKIERLEFEKKPKELGRLDRKQDYFDRKRWTVDVRIDSTRVPALLRDLLGHESVTFEVHKMIVTKSKRSLQKEVVVTRDEERGLAEPPVRVRMLLNALDWKYVAKDDSDEDEEDDG